MTTSAQTITSVAVRWTDRTSFNRKIMGFGSNAITSNTANQQLIPPVGNGGMTDIYMLWAYNASATNTAIGLSDGFNNYTFGAAANSMTLLYQGVVDSPINATSPNTAWTVNTATSVASVTINALYVINSQ